MTIWLWIEEDEERSSQVRPLPKEKIWTLNENNDDNDDDDDMSDHISPVVKPL